MLAACGGDAASTVDAEAALDAGAARAIEEGDWFVCANEACTALMSTGMRLLDHQAWHLIATEQADGQFAEGEPYCLGERFATYTYEAGIVTFTFHDGALTASDKLTIDDSGMTAHGGDMRKVEENASGEWIGEEQRRCVAND